MKGFCQNTRRVLVAGFVALWFATTGVSQSLGDLQVIRFESDDNKYFVTQQYNFTGELQASGVTVGDTYEIEAFLNGTSIYSETVTATVANEQRFVSVDVEFDQPGLNRLVLYIDSNSEIQESDEDNNRSVLNLNVLEFETIVRPNPFTPNEDGFNDEVLFRVSDAYSDQSLEVTIYTLSGKKIITLTSAGSTQVAWNGRNEQNEQMRPGTYLYVMKTDGVTIQRGTISLAL